MEINITFSGAGFLGIYQTGVVACLNSYGSKLLNEVKYIAGCSAGAMNAVNLICSINLKEALALFMEMAAKIRDTTLLGPLTAQFDPVTAIKRFYSLHLPPDAHSIVSGKLFISLTRVSDWKNVVVSEFESNRDLIDALACTSFIPFYSGLKPPTFRGVQYVDGSFTDNLLQHFEGTNITVSVFGGDCDICPDDGHKSPVAIDMNNLPVDVSADNAYRLVKALFPMNSVELSELCRQGFRDTVNYLSTKYPEMITFDVNIVSVSYCCGGTFSNDCTKNQMCLCFNSSDEKGLIFSMLEHNIARERIIKSLVLPEDFYHLLIEIKKVAGEKDFTYKAVTTMVQLVKWFSYPNYYAAKHIFNFIHDLFNFSMPIVEHYSSKNIIADKIFKTAKNAYAAYRGSAKIQRHPSIDEEKRDDINRTRSHLSGAEKSFTAVRSSSSLSVNGIQSVSSDGSNLSHKPFCRDCREGSLNEVKDGKEDNGKYSSSSFKLLLKVGSALFSATDNDYGNDLDYENFSSESDNESADTSGNEEEEEDESSAPIWFLART